MIAHAHMLQIYNLLSIRKGGHFTETCCYDLRLMLCRDQFPHVSEESMLYEDILQVKKDVLLANFVKLYVSSSSP